MYYEYDDNSLLSKLDRRFGRYGLKNLMLIIVIGMAFVWLADYAMLSVDNPTLSSFLYFNKQKVLAGEVWRVITFVFIPESDSIMFLLFSLYFFWFMGNLIENSWGAFKFNIFYLVGYLGSLASGFITGYATSYYLNLTLFLAFAILNPNMQVMLFFVVPIKVKWLAILDGALIALELLVATLPGAIAIIVALLNLILFFWRPVFRSVKNYFRRKRYMRELNGGYREAEKRERKRRIDIKLIPDDESSDKDEDLFS